MAMFRWSKEKQDDEPETVEYDARQEPPWADEDAPRSKRAKRRQAAAERAAQTVDVGGARPSAPPADPEFATLAQRIHDLGAAAARERAAAHERAATLASDHVRAMDAATQRARDAEAEVARLRAEADEKDETHHAEREELVALRRRVEGFEGLKQALQAVHSL